MTVSAWDAAVALGRWEARQRLQELCQALVLQIPPLGKHYSQRWAQEDLLEEQKDGARAAAAADKKKGVLGPLTELDTKGAPIPPLPLPRWAGSACAQWSQAQERLRLPCSTAHLCAFDVAISLSCFLTDVDALLKKSEAQHEQPEDGCPFGPLTQRLLQALVEVRGSNGATP